MTCLVGTSNVYALMWFLRSTVVFKDGPVVAYWGTVILLFGAHKFLPSAFLVPHFLVLH